MGIKVGGGGGSSQGFKVWEKEFLNRILYK
jgi:hypothetical protein